MTTNGTFAFNQTLSPFVPGGEEFSSLLLYLTAVIIGVLVPILLAIFALVFICMNKERRASRRYSSTVFHWLRKKMTHGREIIQLDEAELKMDREMKENITRLMDTSKEQRERLKNYLLNIDKLYRVDPDSERSKNIQQGILGIVETIGQMITERKPELGGRIVPMGSSQNGTKIGDADEFDFVYEIELDALLKGKGTFIGLRKGFDHVFVCIEDNSNLEFFTQVDKKQCNNSKYPNGCWALNPVLVNDCFTTILKTVLPTLTLPPGWGHGGFNRPLFSGMRFQGRSNLLQFDYLDSHDQTPLRMSVDFVPMIKLPMDKIKLNTLFLAPHRRYLLREMSTEYCWWSLYGHSLNRIFFGHVEELWLSRFLNESTPKILIRICKVFHKLVEMYSPIYPDKMHVQDIEFHRKRGAKERDKHSTQFSMNIENSTALMYDANKSVSYSDLNETIGDLCMLKSYHIKTIIMTIMAQDKSQARTWTHDDLLELVISVYMILLDVIQNNSSTASDISHQCIKEELVVNLSGAIGQRENNLTKAQQVKQNAHRVMGETDDAPSVHQAIELSLLEGPHGNETLPVKGEQLLQHSVVAEAEPKFYTDTKELLQNMEMEVFEMLPVLKNRISAIFQILRSVCEGKDSVTIVTLGRLKQEAANTGLEVGRKSEFKKLLQAL